MKYLFFVHRLFNNKYQFKARLKAGFRFFRRIVKNSVLLLDNSNVLYYNNRCVGAWLSLVECLVRDQEAGGSNPLAPTKNDNFRQKIVVSFCSLRSSPNSRRFRRKERMALLPKALTVVKYCDILFYVKNIFFASDSKRRLLCMNFLNG